jgi:glucose-6-phosphate isomerase
LRALTMLYTQDIAHCFENSPEANGESARAYDSNLAETAQSIAKITEWYEQAAIPLLQLPQSVEDLAPLQAISDRYRESFSDVVILGTGGSSLGGKCLCELAPRNPSAERRSPTLHFMDNVDPHSFEQLFTLLSPSTTGLLVISKSGGTAETLAQLNIFLHWYQPVMGPEQTAGHITVIVEPGNSALRQIADKCGFRILDHDPNLGGRFSVFSLVGLLPAMMAGLDPAAIRHGAHETLQQTLGATAPSDSAAAIGAALAVTLERERAISMAVLMLYSDRMISFGQWYRQLWAESLGKAGRGTTPVPFLGTVDQHSQLQLYLDGPKDKFFTMLITDCTGRGPTIDIQLNGGVALGALNGRTMGDLLEASQRATAETLKSNGHPVRILQTNDLSEATVGALMMHFMLETIIAADLVNIDPFDQPAVEQSKVLARKFLMEMDSS